MNKMIRHGFLLALTVLALGTTARASTDPADSGLGDPPRAVKSALKFEIPGSENGVPDVYRRWSQPKICKVSKSATCVVCEASAAGIVTSIEVSSGAIGAYGVALDTGSTNSASASAPVAGQQLTSQRTCEYTLATTGLSTGACGLKQFDEGRPFHTGLTICTNDATTEMEVLYRVLRR